MLETVDLSLQVDKETYRQKMAECQDRLRVLQYDCRQAKVPVVVVFEGWDASGKGTTIEKMIDKLDPRHSRVEATYEPNVEEALRPFLWRFWLQLPNDGDMVFFDRSWYGRVLVERMRRIVPKKSWREGYEEIRAFERQLTDHGTVLLKFFLHISKKEQKKRLKDLLEDKFTRWKVSKDDKWNHAHYYQWVPVYDEMFERTSTTNAPWTIVEAEDGRYGRLKVMETAIAALEARLEAAKNPPPTSASSWVRLQGDPKAVLGKVDLSLRFERDAYDKELKKYQARVRDLEFKLFERRIPCVIGYEGWDAAGKGGNIKRLTQSLDPRGYNVIPIAAPQGEERTHQYLWRFWRHMPKAGHMTIFDRTWYGRVLVERIEGFCSEAAWQRAYQEINEFEMSLANYGTVICKFWVHIGNDEQLRRFEERQQIDHKRFKITDEDWRNRERWGAYEDAVGEMIMRTSTTYAPWTIVEGNDKLWARIRVLKTVCEAIEKRLEQ